MATSEFWQRLAASMTSVQDVERLSASDRPLAARGSSKIWILLDIFTVMASVTAATIYEFHNRSLGARGLWLVALTHSQHAILLFGMLCFYTLSIVVLSRSMSLYSPNRLSGYLHEQRLSAQACFTAGLWLAGTLYLIRDYDAPRTVVLLTIAFVTVLLAVRRLAFRIHLYRKFEHGVGTRNVLIVGTGPEAQALRHHLDNVRNLGYAFKGFIEVPSNAENGHQTPAGDVLGTLDSLFQHTRRLFVDEIFFTTRCEREVVEGVLIEARRSGVDLRVVPDLYDGLAWNNPIEFVGQFPTIPLHSGTVPELGLHFKRVFDIVFSVLVLLLLSPVFLAVAIAIKLDSSGPAFYASDRIGKKGRVFKCIKFRTMVQDAEKRRAELMHLNERQDVLFKVSNDPRITAVGGWLRKHSLDELPQFFNVLKGDMSVVGPRPPIASEVKEYKLSHLRRLAVMPGITGLWQVQGRQDPSFASYVSMDMTYIDNWSLWLDFKIVIRTVAVVLAGTGT